MSFFSVAKYRFLTVPEDGRIETKPFLNACTEVVPFFVKDQIIINNTLYGFGTNMAFFYHTYHNKKWFPHNYIDLDVLGSTAFTPVKSDINGNIKKLTALYDSNPQKYKTLQDIVDSEVQTKTTKARNSGTDALLWLKRAMQFILSFLKNILSGDQDLLRCANKAYEKTLKQYHNFIVKGIFNLALRSIPYRKDFIECLGKGEADELTVLEDMQNFVDELDSNIFTIQEFYTNNGVDI